MEGANLLHAVFMAAIAVVVARVTVHIAVGQDKIDGGVLPAKRCGFIRFGALKQQQAITASGGLQGNVSVLYRRGLFAVEITHYCPFRESIANVQRQRFTIPLRTLADSGCHRLFCCTLNCQQQCGRAGASINPHLIFTVAEKAPLRRRAIAGFERQHLIEFYRL